ncbi:hypothetical protein CDAR_256011 [Caerostris darwini]|uniref:Uncharacterized protein n=1 Tax=Caerostris darwini TaxID=1538125 RepID=A0AAV4PTG0_9ARAC|nr:hypothetical protein CDAR_256011 [Caerostris darwini]
MCHYTLCYAVERHDANDPFSKIYGRRNISTPANKSLADFDCDRGWVNGKSGKSDCGKSNQDGKPQGHKFSLGPLLQPPSPPERGLRAPPSYRGGDAAGLICLNSPICLEEVFGGQLPRDPTVKGRLSPHIPPQFPSKFKNPFSPTMPSGH